MQARPTTVVNPEKVFTPAWSLCIFFDELHSGLHADLRRVWELARPLYTPRLNWYRTERMPYAERVDADVIDMIPTWFADDARHRSNYRWKAYGGTAPHEVSPWRVELYIDSIKTPQVPDKALLRAVFGPGADSSPTQVNCLRFCMPCDTAEYSISDFSALCWQLFEIFPLLHGHAGYSLVFDDAAQSLSPQEWLSLYGLAIRHPGYDLFSYESVRSFVHERIPTVDWLTLLGDGLAAECTVQQLLRGTTSGAIRIVPSMLKLLIRAGRIPAVGDVNRGDSLPLYREVAAALKPISCIGFAPFSRFLDEEKTEAWVNRFLDNE